MSAIGSTPDVTTLGLQDTRRENEIKAAQKGRAKPTTQAEKINRLKEIRQACAGIEAVFVGSLIKAMRQTIPDNGLLPKHPGSDIYEGIMDEKLAGFLSDKVGTGMGQILFNQMVHKEGLEEVAEKEAANLGIKYEKLIPVGHKKRDSIWDSQVMDPVNHDENGKKVPPDAEKIDADDSGTKIRAADREPGEVLRGMENENTG